MWDSFSMDINHLEYIFLEWKMHIVARQHTSAIEA